MAIASRGSSLLGGGLRSELLRDEVQAALVEGARVSARASAPAQAVSVDQSSAQR